MTESEIGPSLLAIPEENKTSKVMVDGSLDRVDSSEGPFEKREEVSLGFIDLLRSTAGDLLGIRICLFEPEDVQGYTDALPKNCVRAWGAGFAWEFVWNKGIEVDETKSGDQMLSYVGLYAGVGDGRVAVAFPMDLFGSEAIA